MTLDNFFAGSKGVWERELARRDKEAADKLAAEAAARRAEIEGRRGVKPSQTESVGTRPPLSVSVDFSILDGSDYYRITGIRHRDSVVAYDLSKSLLERKTQDAHAKHAVKVGPDEFRGCSAALVYAIAKTLYVHKDVDRFKETIENARAGLQAHFARRWLNTLSRAQYTPQGLDKIVHDYGQKTQYDVPADLVGPYGFITDAKVNAQTYAQALLGTTDDADSINKVVEWICGKPAYAYRLNSRRENKEERVVALGVGSDDWFSLGAVVSIGNVGPALGVRFVEQNFSGVSQ